MTVLEVRDLTTEYRTRRGPVRAVDGVSFALDEGETLGVVGESGSGKTTVGKSILRLLPPEGSVVSGEVRFDGRDLTALTERELRETLRWQELAWIPQNAMNALDPVYTVGAQMSEVIRTHTDRSRRAARRRARELLEMVELDPARLDDYRHELSGGQRQRVVVAMALALDPAVLVADEPTTGLDVVIQDSVLELVSELQAEFDTAMLFVTHDVGVARRVSDRCAVMYGGRIVETGPAGRVFEASGHPYTMGLANASPSLEADGDRLVSIPGEPPDLVDPPGGCRFADRCPFATEECEAEPPSVAVGENHSVDCHHTDSMREFRRRSREAETWR